VTPAWDLIESYVRLGRINEARQTLNRAEREIPPVAPPELAVICRCRGLIDEHFEPQFEQALTLDMLLFDRARCELVYGERLRRARQRRRAREHLRAAATIFGDLGAHAWAERANTELRASGERRQSRDASREQLTPRETQIAIAVAEGASNRDVAAALFVTPKTVEYHLTRVYRKLGVRSRAELVKHYHR
jgi:DNA-binding CsgD family transcriptional regulator